MISVFMATFIVSILVIYVFCYIVIKTLLVVVRRVSNQKKVFTKKKKSRVKMVIKSCPYSTDYIDIVHYYWGWFPVIIVSAYCREDAYKALTAYKRLLSMRGKNA